MARARVYSPSQQGEHEENRLDLLHSVIDLGRKGQPTTDYADRRPRSPINNESGLRDHTAVRVEAGVLQTVLGEAHTLHAASVVVASTRQNVKHAGRVC
ncbi:hypothetical protein MRX96_009247 [Rhipicephalus microplus]